MNIYDIISNKALTCACKPALYTEISRRAAANLGIICPDEKPSIKCYKGVYSELYNKNCNGFTQG